MRRLFPFVFALAVSLLTGCAAIGHLVDNATGEDVNRAIREGGVAAQATVLDIWDTGTRVNDDPVVGFRLAVETPDGERWEAETRSLVSILAIPRIQPGAVLPVRYDPAAREQVAIDVEAWNAAKATRPVASPD